MSSTKNKKRFPASGLSTGIAASLRELGDRSQHVGHVGHRPSFYDIISHIRRPPTSSPTEPAATATSAKVERSCARTGSGSSGCGGGRMGRIGALIEGADK